MSTTELDPTRIDIEFDPAKQRMNGIATHGMTPFDVPFISQIEGNLWQGGCREGLILPTFFKHVVSLYKWESYTVEHDLETSMTVKMFDSIGQGFEEIDDLAEWVNMCCDDGPTLVHCQAGLNRSSLVAGRTLTLRGWTPAQAIELLRQRRSPACLCNRAFEEWLLAQGGRP